MWLIVVTSKGHGLQAAGKLRKEMIPLSSNASLSLGMNISF